NWHWYWDTGNGDTGNTGPHQLDIARWGMNKNEHPVAIYSTGGLFGLNGPAGATPGTTVYGNVETYGHDQTTQETPNTQTAAFTYADGKIIELETRGHYTNHEGSDGREVGNLFYGSEGWLEISGHSWKAFRRRERQPFTQSNDADKDRGDHWANFLDAVRSGNDADMHSDIHSGHLSTTLCHLANISYRVGRSLRFLGTDEKFVDDEAADAMLTRDYRAPFVVPQTV
ncbi:MAG: hypothetical protein KDB23_18080, partial [Planctomycetales bacterium]|nr:hypothetical protein [Planctomycetales bacterium]